MHSDAVRKESLERVPTRPRGAARWLVSVALATGTISPAAAWAQATPPPATTTPSTPSTQSASPTTPGAPSAKPSPLTKSDVKTAVTDPSGTVPPGTYSPWQKAGLNGAMHLEFHGNAIVDVGYVKYSFPNNTALTPNDPDTVYDARGRFVLGPDLDFEFAPKYFFHGRAQLVAQVRDVTNNYIGNADDVYVQAGQRDVWDVQLGRFMTWRVFRKGMGFDLFTLEDQGPTFNQHVSDTAQYASNNSPLTNHHIYEVSHIYQRDTQGRAAFHVYPTPWSGIEIASEYGRQERYNSIGGRAAANVTYGPISVSLAGETKQFKLAVPIDACPTCEKISLSGYGGGAVLDFKVVEAGANFARGKKTVVAAISAPNAGFDDPAASSTTNSFGGYLEVDPGTLIFQRRVVLGGGWNRSEFLYGDNRFLRHTQMAGYIAFPFGFNDSMVKFVVTQEDLVIDTPIPEMPQNLTENVNKLFAASVRTSFRF
jgi:hypothetical protein